jgi:hypothetical protein
MPRRFVETPDGKLALFSTIVDYFVAYNMTDEDAVELCAEEMDLHGDRAAGKVAEGRRDLGRWFREVETIRRVHGQKKLEEHMEEIGFTDWLIVYEVMTS